MLYQHLRREISTALEIADVKHDPVAWKSWHAPPRTTAAWSWGRMVGGSPVWSADGATASSATSQFSFLTAVTSRSCPRTA